MRIIKGFFYVLGLLAVVSVSRFIGAEMGRSDALAVRASQHQSVERNVLNDPEMGAMFRALKEHYPEKYQDFLSEAESYARGPDAANSFQHMAQYSAEMMRPLREMYPYYSDAHIVKIHQQKSDLLKMLRSGGSSYCADFIHGRPNRQAMDLPGVSRQFSLISFEVITAAAESQGNQFRPEPSESDYSSMVEGMLDHGATYDLIERANSYGLETLSDSEQCDFIIAMYDSTSAMPPDSRIGMMSALMEE